MDPATGDIYGINNDTLNWMTVFDRNAKGNASPYRKLATPHTTFGIVVDESNDDMFLTIQDDHAIVVYNKYARDKESPRRIVQGRNPAVQKLLLARMSDVFAGDPGGEIALYRRGGCWGVISKTNGSVLRSRDPVYRSLRELAMSYSHEYANKHGERTLREYSVPYDLRRLSPAIWVTGEEDCWEVGQALDAARHYRLMTPAQLRRLTKRDAFEQQAGDQIGRAHV